MGTRCPKRWIYACEILVDPACVAIRGVWALSLIALVGSLAVLVLPASASPATAHTTVGLSSLESGVLQQLNKIRVQHKLAPLKLSGRLSEASAQHSKEMAADGYFEHASDDGTLFWKRIGRWYGPKGFHYWSVGENLLWSSPGVDSVGAAKLWMNSPEHRANILTAAWREIGISAVHMAAAPGVYKGLEVTIITTDFGVRH
jgi:uncharacterized protein YkwD